MRMPSAFACVLCPICLAASLAVRASGDELFDVEKWRAVQKQAQAQQAVEANKVRVDIERQIKEVEKKLVEARKWTRAQFELGERNVIDKPKAMCSLFKHWQSQREHEMYAALQFPDKFAGAIESGHALNLMLESAGAAAYQNSETRKIKPELALPLCDSTQSTKVDAALLEEITWQENTLGSKLVGQGSRGLLDLDWPAVLREEPWKEYRERFDEARNKAWAEVSASNVMSSAADTQLREAVAALNAEFAKYRSEWVCSDQPNVDRALEYRRICDGTRHIQKLVMGTYQLVELSKNQTTYRETFQGGTIEEFMAFYHRNQLRFAAASPAHRLAYHKIFNMMVRYYLDQKVAVNLEQHLEKELAELKQNDKDAIDRVLDRTMSATDTAAIKIQTLQTISTMMQAAARQPQGNNPR